MTVHGKLIFLGLAIGLMFGAIGASIWGKLGASPAPAEIVLLDADLRLRSEGTTYAFTSRSGGPVVLTIDLPEGGTQEVHVSISPVFVAMRPEPVYEPGEPEHVITVPAAGLLARRLVLAREGAYVLRIEPVPMAMAHEGAPPTARVRVHAVPDD